LIRDMYEKNNQPSVSLPDWCSELQKGVGEIGTTIKIEKAEFINLVKNDTILTKDNKIWKYDKIYEEELEHMNQLGNIFDSAKNVYDGVKWGMTAINSILDVFEDHYQAMEVLNLILESNKGDNEYKQAVLNLASQYQTKFGAGLAKFRKEFADWIEKKGYEIIDAAIFSLIGGEKSYLKLGTIVADTLIKVSGIKDYGDAAQLFFTRYSSQQALAEMYSNAVSEVRLSGGNPTDEQVSKVQTLFLAYRSATARTFEALADYDSDNSMYWMQVTKEVRKRTMPGI